MHLTAGFLFVIHYHLQALPHPTSVEASVIGFHLPPILSFFIFDVSSKVVMDFLVCVHVLFLVSGSSSLFPSADTACNPWFLVWILSYSHCGEDVVYAFIDEAYDCCGQCYRINPGT